MCVSTQTTPSPVLRLISESTRINDTAIVLEYKRVTIVFQAGVATGNRHQNITRLGPPKHVWKKYGGKNSY